MQLRIKCDTCGRESYREAIERKVPTVDRTEKGRVLYEVPPCPYCVKLQRDGNAMILHLTTACNELDTFNKLLEDYTEVGDVANTNEIGRRLKRVLYLLKQRLEKKLHVDVIEPGQPAQPKRKRVGTSSGIGSGIKRIT